MSNCIGGGRAAVAAVALCVVAVACCDDDVRSVTLEWDRVVRPSATLWLGDTLTVLAAANTASRSTLWCPGRRLYSSVDHPGRFTYLSTDTSVATIDPTGLLVVRRRGTTTLTANTAGVVSYKVELITAPALATLGLVPAAPTLAVGDTIIIRVGAFDGAGNPVAGARVVYGVTPDSIVRLTGVPRLDASSSAILTPFELHAHALRPGSATVSVTAPHHVSSNSDVTRSITLLVVPPPGPSR